MNVVILGSCPPWILGDFDRIREPNRTSHAKGGAPQVMIIGLPASRKHRYEATLKFEENAGDLAIPPPRVQVDLDSFVREDLMIVGAILDALGFALCLVGVAMAVAPLLRSKFSRSKTLPELG